MQREAVAERNARLARQDKIKAERERQTAKREALKAALLEVAKQHDVSFDLLVFANDEVRDEIYFDDDLPPRARQLWRNGLSEHLRNVALVRYLTDPYLNGIDG
jgi:hypothetical protein